MKNRASSHLFVLLLIVGFEIAGYFGIYRAALLRGYETSIIGAVRDLMMYVPLVVLLLWLSRVMKFAGNWILFTAAILLFSLGTLVQYRLYSDPEYNARNKAAARQEKMAALRTRYILENYDPVKKQIMGLPPTPAQPIDIDQLPRRKSNYTLWNAITASYTWIPILSFVAFAVAYSFCVRDGFLLWLQRNSFIIVLLTLVPLAETVDYVRMSDPIDGHRLVLKVCHQRSLQLGIGRLLQVNVERFDDHRGWRTLRSRVVLGDVDLGVAAPSQAFQYIVTAIEPALLYPQFRHQPAFPTIICVP